MYHQFRKQEPNMVNLQAILVVMIATSQLMIGQLRTASKFPFPHSLCVPSSGFPAPDSTPDLPSNVLPDPVTSPPMETAALMTRTREEILSLAQEWGLWLEV